MGRPRKTKAQHKRDGSARKDRHPETVEESVENTFTAGSPAKPKKKLKPEQNELWELIKKRVPEKFLGEIDGPALQALCIWWQRWKQFDASIDTAADAKEEYLALVSSCAAWKQCEKLMGKFGMTPRDRTYIRELLEGGGKATSSADWFVDMFGRSEN